MKKTKVVARICVAILALFFSTVGVIAGSFSWMSKVEENSVDGGSFNFVAKNDQLNVELEVKDCFDAEGYVYRDVSISAEELTRIRDLISNSEIEYEFTPAGPILGNCFIGKALIERFDEDEAFYNADSSCYEWSYFWMNPDDEFVAFVWVYKWLYFLRFTCGLPYAIAVFACVVGIIIAAEIIMLLVDLLLDFAFLYVVDWIPRPIMMLVRIPFIFVHCCIQELQERAEKRRLIKRKRAMAERQRQIPRALSVPERRSA